MKKGFRYFFTSVLSIFLTLIVVSVIYIVCDNDSKVDVEKGQTYTSEEVEVMVEDAKEEGRQGLLDQIRTSLEEGNPIISILKGFYPDYIIVAANSKYNFIQIDHSLAMNSYNIDNLTENENGVYQYSVDGDVVSHFGIDVSSHQGDIDWQSVADSGVEFAIIRAVYRGYGTGKIVVDEKCIQNIEGAQAAGIKVGVYVFSQAITQAEVLEEASTVKTLLEGYTLDLPVVFDVEKVTDKSGRMNQLTVDERTNVTKAFLEDMEASGYDTMIYHNTEMGAMLLDLSQLTEYKKWFAGYNKEFYWPYEFDVWQYSESGKVSGIDGNVDFDIWLGDY
ncbi:MAG: glycoside hydrolase family 25 protein [Pseudobutyrivibrio sp.]|nr:glycoside hydrolase family 25 protein [Pseudobutyrivibrio sp.]